MTKPAKIGVTMRSGTGGVFEYKEYPADVHIEAEPEMTGQATELWIEGGSFLIRCVASPGGSMEIAGV